MRARPGAGRGEAGGAREIVDRRAQVVGQGLEVAHGVVVAEQAEPETTVIAHDRDAQRLVVGERDHGIEADHLAPEQVERDLRPGDVRHDEVEEALARLKPRGLRHDRRGREVGQGGQRHGADGLARLLDPAHRLGDLRQHRLGVGHAHGQRRPHGGDAVAQRAALRVRPDRDRDHGLEHQPVGLHAAAAQEAPERQGDRGEHDVVERAAQGVLDRLEARDLGVDPRVAPVRADRHVEGRRRRRVEPRPRHRAHADEPLARLLEHLTRRAGERAQPAGALGRHRRALDQRLGQQLGGGRLRARYPLAALRRRWRWVGREVEEHRRDVDAAHAVHQRMVGLRDDREAVAFEPLDQVELPQRLGPVQWEGEQAPREVAQLLVGAGGGQRAVAHVVAGVEVRIVDPHRAPLAPRHVGQLLAVARNEVHTRLDRLDQLVVGGRRPFEDEHAGHVHVRAAALEVQEAGVQSGQAVEIGHGSILTCRRRAHNLAQPSTDCVSFAHKL